MAALSDLPDSSTIHIVRYHQAWMEEDRLYIQTELCSSNLLEELRSNHGIRKTAEEASKVYDAKAKQAHKEFYYKNK